MIRVVVFVFLVVAGASPVALAEDTSGASQSVEKRDVGPFRVRNVSVPEGPVIQGEAIPVQIEMESFRSGARKVIIDHVGLPKDLSLELYDEEGGRIPTPLELAWESGAMKGLLPVGSWPFFEYTTGTLALESGGILRVACDLNKRFDIRKGGTYRLKANALAENEMERTLEILALHPLQTVHVKEHCSGQPGMLSQLKELRGGRTVELDAGIYETRPKNGAGVTYFAVRNIATSDYPLDHTLKQLLHETPKGTQLEKVLLDFNWSLWAILKHEGQYSLVRWQVGEGAAEVKIPWQEKPPYLEESTCKLGSGVKIVFWGADAEAVNLEM